MNEQERAAAVSGVCREAAEMAAEARRRGGSVRPGAVTPSGWRVVALAPLHDVAGGREDLWAVRAPGADGHVLLIATSTPFPFHRFYARPCSWAEAEHLVAAWRARAAGTEALLAAARAATVARPRGGGSHAGDVGGQHAAAVDPRTPGREPLR